MSREDNDFTGGAVGGNVRLTFFGVDYPAHPRMVHQVLPERHSERIEDAGRFHVRQRMGKPRSISLIQHRWS